MINTESLTEDLRNKNLRITKLRKAMIGILLQHKMPISVAELRLFLLKLYIDVHKTSIYRELAVLKENNIIREIQFGENKKRYELKSRSHHHHLICTHCDKVEDVILENDLNMQEKKIMKQKDFKILSHSLEFFGICSKCNN